jgi:hypothetical protein
MPLVLKLKPDRSITGAVVPLAMLPIFAIVTLTFGYPVGMVTIAVLAWAFALFYLYVFVRTGNWVQLFVCIYAIFTGYMLMMLKTAYLGASVLRAKDFGLAYFTSLVFFGGVFIYVVLTRKFKWRGREIFELAAEPVEETGNGYTARPRPVGKVEYSPQQMRFFARFAARHLIALPYYSSKNITLVPVKMGDEYGRLLGVSGDYRDATWVSFDVDGEVSVHIAQKDYLDYRESPSFDPLCISLGQVFIDFLELYSKGEGVRVIDRLDDLKIPVLS